MVRRDKNIWETVMILAMVFSMAFMSLTATVEASRPAKAERARIATAYGKLPLYFIKNTGQVDKRVMYYEKGSAHSTYFTKDGVYIVLRQTEKKSRAKGIKAEVRSEVVRLTFLNPDSNAEIVAEGRQKGRVNYFIGGACQESCV